MAPIVFVQMYTQVLTLARERNITMIEGGVRLITRASGLLSFRCHQKMRAVHGHAAITSHLLIRAKPYV